MNKKISFYKYQGAGNDFIILDNRNSIYNHLSQHEIAKLCDRRFGIGADGLMMLENHHTHDFQMVYFNSDGLPGTMCGNGGRCIVAFAKKLGIGKEKFSFWASDGVHQAEVISELDNQLLVKLQMKDVFTYNRQRSYFVIDTGSPHYVKFVEDVEGVNVVHEGRKIRYSPKFPEGINVNFVEMTPTGLWVRTYERGVEDETYSCGTGSVASALAYSLLMKNPVGKLAINVLTKGGHLQIDATIAEGKSKHFYIFKEIYLQGLTQFVFQGEFA